MVDCPTLCPTPRSTVLEKSRGYKLDRFRRSVRTAWAEELKVPDHIAELMLAHKRDKLVWTYNKSLMLEDQKAAWVAWAALLERYRQWVALRNFVLCFFGHTVDR